MPNVPAFCDTCGTVFSSGLYAENSGITFTDCQAGPCLNCGGIGHIPDGVFKFIGNTIEIISAPERTVKELKRLSEILQEARTSRAEPEAVAKQIQSELPALAAIAKLLPSNRGELYGFLAVVLAAIQLYLTVSPPSAQPPVQITVNQVVEQAVSTKATKAPPAKQSVGKKKIGRNAPCPCNSGSKYKKCCGRVA